MYECMSFTVTSEITYSQIGAIKLNRHVAKVGGKIKNY